MQRVSQAELDTVLGRTPRDAITGNDTRAVAYWLESQRLFSCRHGAYGACTAAPTEAVAAALRLPASARYPAYSLSLLFPDSLRAHDATAWTWLVLSPVSSATYRTVWLNAPTEQTSDIVGTRTAASAHVIIPSDPLSGLRLHAELAYESVYDTQVMWPAAAVRQTSRRMLVCDTGTLDYATLTLLAACDTDTCIRVTRFDGAQACVREVGASFYSAWQNARPVIAEWHDITRAHVREGRLQTVAEALAESACADVTLRESVLLMLPRSCPAQVRRNIEKGTCDVDVLRDD